MTPIRIGIIGAGGNTRKMHIPGFQALKGVEVVTVCNRSEESSQRAADEFGIPRISATWQDVVNDPEVDAICIGTWPYMHAEISIAALEAGKHVLTEARMAMNLKEAEKMLKAAEAHPKLVAQIVPAPFSLKYDATIARMLAEGKLGDIREIRVTHLVGANSDPTVPLIWRQNTKFSGKNIMTMGILYETVQRWLGDVDIEWVQALGRVFTPEREDPETGEMAPVEIPDTISLTAGYPDGSQLRMTLSSIATGSSYLGIRIDGSKASLQYDFGDQQLYKADVGKGHKALVKAPVREQGSWQVEKDFIASIREGKPVYLTSFADGVRYMRFTERVWDSWTHSGKRVKW